MADSTNILILGGTGAIGSALGRAYQHDETAHIVAASRSSFPAGDGGHSIHLDVLDRDSWNNLPDQVQTSFFCFGKSSIAECESDPKGTSRMNLEATLELAALLHEAGSQVVFLSTSLVFDGREPWPSENDGLSPQGEYARQKSLAEASLLNAHDRTAVVRLTKYLGSMKALLSAWVENLRSGSPIEAFWDRRVSLVDESTLTGLLRRIASENLTGIFHASGESDLTYHELAILLARQTGGDRNLVQPVSAVEKLGEDHHDFPWVRYAALGMTQTTRTTGIEPTSLRAVNGFLAGLS